MKIENVRIEYRYLTLHLTGSDNEGHEIAGTVGATGAETFSTVQTIPHLHNFVQRHRVRLMNFLRAELLKERGTALSADARYIDQQLAKLQSTLAN